jgi:hypothetical protein
VRQAAIYGIMAEFGTGEELVHAAHAAYSEGFRQMDAYSPQPVHGLAEVLHAEKTGVPLVVLIGGLLGAAGGYGLCYFMTALAYVHNVGGRPIHSWPSYIPITFETGVLCASLSAVVGMIAMNGLPRPYHPVFNARRFDLASYDRFFLCIESQDPKFDVERTRDFLLSQDPYDVTVVYD